MLRASKIHKWIVILFVSLTLARNAACEETQGELSVEEIRALLNSIDPYLPKDEIKAEIDLFGSTSMDTLVSGWAVDFKKFHPEAKVVISAEGSETVFERLAKNPASMGMLSRPVTAEDLAKLKAAGLKQPVAITVAREAIGVFVSESNPLESITQQQFLQMFCATADSTELRWQTLGVEGKLADQPVQILARSEGSGTQKFIKDYLLTGHTLRAPTKVFPSNAQVIKQIESNAAGVALCGLKCGGHGAKALDLLEGTRVIPHDDHSVLLGQYPLVRPMVVVLDLGHPSASLNANREFLRYALHQAGQTQTILAGFFPFDPPTLRGELARLEQDTVSSK